MRGLKHHDITSNTTKILSHLLQMRGLKHFRLDRKHHRHKVASFTDAWIETAYTTTMNLFNKVASFTDAWIETRKLRQLLLQVESHLLQMRGLKP